MPPKVKVTREEIVLAAVDIVRQSGEGALNARSIAARIGCSTQPVFSNFATMDDLRGALLERARALYDENTKRTISLDKYPPYKASGMAYIDFARREKELFKLLFMRERSSSSEPEPDRLEELYSGAVDTVSRTVGMDKTRSSDFHFEMWAFVHGIASMLATGYLELDEETISAMLTDVFTGLKMRFGVN